ncbi:MAG TPA: hypothetical protein VF725_12050 [Ktedonobacterales bacterium]|jgi:hypothetical protein
MNIMELLILVSARLRPLAVADEQALQAMLEEVAAGPPAEGAAPDIAPRLALAGQLIVIEHECRMLREHLHVQLTGAARIEVKSFLAESASAESEPEDQNKPK